MRAVAISLVIVVVVVAAGCPDLSVPSTANVRCSSDDDCPRDTRCQIDAERCVPKTGDGTPPTLVAHTLSASAAAVGTVVTLDLTADGPLLLPPDVRLRVGDTDVAFAVDSSDGAEAHLSFAPGAQLSQGTWPIVATLVDVSGELALDVAVDDLTLDFAAPRVLSVSADRDFAKDGDVVHVVFAFDEAVVDVAVDDARSADGEFDIANDADEDDDGAVDLDVVATDAAGNVSAPVVFPAVFVRDFTAPVIEAAPAPFAFAPVARRGQLAGAGFRVSEPLSVLPTAVAVFGTTSLPLTVSVDEVDDQKIDATIIVDDEMPDGDYVVQLAGLVDRAGNVGADVDDLIVFAIDNDGPIITDISHPPVVGAGEVVIFCGVQDGDGPPTATLGTRGPVVCEQRGSATCDDAPPGGCFACTFTVGENDADVGLLNITISAVDGAGNSAFESDSIVVDVDAPVVVAATASAAAYRDGDVVVVRVDVDGPLSAPPDLRAALRRDDDGGPPSSLPAGCFDQPQALNSTGFTFRCDAAVLGSGRFHLELDLVDQAVNFAHVDVGSAADPLFVVDSAAPTFLRPLQVCREDGRCNGPNLFFSNVEGFNSGDVRFSLDEDVGDGARVFVGEVELDGCDVVDAGGRFDYRCPFAVVDLAVGANVNETRVVLVAASDAAGNSRDDSDFISFDTDAPRITGGPTVVLQDFANANPLADRSVVEGAAAIVGVATRVQVTQTFTEQVTVPQVRAVSPSGAVRVVCSDLFGCGSGFAQFSLILADDVDTENGLWHFEIDVVDLVGNVGLVDTIGVVVDTVAPAPPDPRKLRMSRVALGSDGNNVRAVAVVADAGAVDACANDARCDRVLAFSAPREGLELARTTLLPGASSFSLPLTGDRPDAWIAVVDVAGNISPRSRAAGGEWVVTAADKVAGSTFANPTTLALTSNFRRSFTQDPLTTAEPDDVSGAFFHDDDAVVAGGSGAFVELRAGVLPELIGPSLVVDSVRGVVVLVGLDRFDQQQTVEFDLVDKSVRAITGGLPQRVNPALGFDPLRGRALLFGGEDPFSGGFSDTWEWDGARWTRRATEGPPPGGKGALAFLPRLNRTVFVTADLRETWTWDGARWAPLVTAHTPPTRTGAALGVDEISGTLIAFGGQGDAGGALGDTWRFDGDDWTEIVTTGVTPPALVGASLVVGFDGLLHLLGGTNGNVANNARLAFDPPSTWRSEQPATLPTSIASDIVVDRGNDGALVVDRTGVLFRHDFLFAVWRPLMSPLSPQAPLAADPRGGGVIDAAGHRVVDGVVVAVAGADANGLPAAGCTFASGVNDPDGAVFAFGGFRNGAAVDELWSWDGSVWRERPRLDPWPPPRTSAALAFDAARGVLVVVGGDPVGGATLDDVWEYDGDRFVDRTPVDAIDARSGAAAAFFDGAVVVTGGVRKLNGGGVTNDDVLVWNGSAFSTLRGPRFPARSGHSLVVDTRRNELLLFGGLANAFNVVAGGSDALDDLWRFDGAVWTLVDDIVVRPPPRAGHGAAYDRGNDAMFVSDGDLWRFARRPAALWSIPFAAAGAGDAVATSMALRVFGGVPGNSTMSLWRPGQQRWQPQGGGNCGPGVSEDFCSVSFVSPFTVDPAPFLTGVAQTLHIAITPRIANGDDDVTFDSGELRVAFAAAHGPSVDMDDDADVDLDNCAVAAAADGALHLAAGAGTCVVSAVVDELDARRFPRLLVRFSTTTATAARVGVSGDDAVFDLDVVADGEVRAYEVDVGGGLVDGVFFEVDDGGEVDVDFIRLAD